ncbi:MAG: pyruvate formate lyase-activating protein [Spirochaetaceae bacterium]|nr:pyruvate formate lyase-activating protein [Spirochaetaceae bacterium]
MKTGRIHSIESLGSLDGPGIRTVFFMQGCNMKCLYCHNRDSWDCRGGEVISTGEILSAVKSYRAYYGHTGGVTFSGGEPLLQSDFLLEVVTGLKDMGVHCAIDTSGSLYNGNTERLIDQTDLVILDIKHSDPHMYRTLCGSDGSASFRTLEYLKKSRTPYWIRQVIVPGYTDSFQQIDMLKELIMGKKSPERVELLPYHDGGKDKWISLGQQYPLEAIGSPPSDLMSVLRTRLTSPS